jgi:hypothetical protein
MISFVKRIYGLRSDNYYFPLALLLNIVKLKPCDNKE